MPIYEYRCDHCGIFERLEQIDAVPHLVCSACGCGITKLVSICAFTMDTDCPNHPDKVEKKANERKMQSKKGTLGEWQNEHKKKYNRDTGRVGCNVFGSRANPGVVRKVKRTRGDK